jgi:diphosphomevalonate decarboxylase
MELSTCYQSSPNIALIKYWGKYDENYILPINDSVGLTLDPKDFHTKTTINFSQKLHSDILILNKK